MEILGILFLAFGGFVALGNLAILILNLAAIGRGPSFVPFVGGLLLIAGLLIYPSEWTREHWWLGLVLDAGMGLVPLVVLRIPMLLLDKKVERVPRSEPRPRRPVKVNPKWRGDTMYVDYQGRKLLLSFNEDGVGEVYDENSRPTGESFQYTVKFPGDIRLVVGDRYFRLEQRENGWVVLPDEPDE